MKKGELKDIAKEMGLPSDGTKADIIERINVAQAGTTMDEIKDKVKDIKH
jgi:hypothetical protein